MSKLIDFQPDIPDAGRARHVSEKHSGFHGANNGSSLQAKLANSGRMFNSLVHNLNGMVYCCLNDAKWTMVFVGGECAELTGYEADVLLSSPTVCFESITHSEDRERVRNSIEQAIFAHQRVRLQYRIEHEEGKIRWVSERGSPLYNDKGEVEAIEG